MWPMSCSLANHTYLLVVFIYDIYTGPLIDVAKVITTFMQVNDIANTTGVLLDYLKPRGDREEDGALQVYYFEEGGVLL